MMNLLCVQGKKSRSDDKEREFAKGRGGKPRSMDSGGAERGSGRLLPLGTRVPKKIARGALDAWVRENAQGSTGKTWRSWQVESTVICGISVVYTNQPEEGECPIEVESDRIAAFGVITQQVSLH